MKVKLFKEYFYIGVPNHETTEVRREKVAGCKFQVSGSHLSLFAFLLSRLTFHVSLFTNNTTTLEQVA
jgi:hypothetical protein